MKLDQLNMRALRFFIAVCHQQNFSDIARKENVSASMVSRVIQQLEDTLGVPLLYRNTRSVTPTDAGLQFLESAQKMMVELDWVEQELHSHQQRVQGMVRINAPISFAGLHIVPHLTGLQARYPHLQVELTQSDEYIDPHRISTDLMFRIATFNDSSLKARRFCKVKYGLYASKAYLDRLGEPQTLSHLSQHQAVVYKGHLGLEPWLARPDGKQDWQPCQAPVILATNNGDTMKTAALQGLGIALLPDWAVYDVVEGGQLQPILPQYDWCTRPYDIHIAAVYPNARQPSYKVRAVIDYFAERFGERVYWQDMGSKTIVPI